MPYLNKPLLFLLVAVSGNLPGQLIDEITTFVACAKPYIYASTISSHDTDIVTSSLHGSKVCQPCFIAILVKLFVSCRAADFEWHMF